MGRPKGSKNKPKIPVVAAAPNPAPSPVEEPKKRGRPPGAKNPVPSVPQTTKAPETVEVPKRRGRPPGSKNQGKDDPTPTPTTSTLTEEPKRRGRPAKVVVPSLPTAQASTPPIPAGASATPSVPKALVVTRTEAEDDTAAGTQALYTEEQLNNPALDFLEEHAKVFLTLASAHRKVMFESKASASMTVERGALKTLIDFFEIDVEALIKNAKTQKSNKAVTGGPEK